METKKRELMKASINKFFVDEDIDLYFNDEDIDKTLMAQQFNEYNEDGFTIPMDEEEECVDMDSPEMEILLEWMEENGWIE